MSTARKVYSSGVIKTSQSSSNKRLPTQGSGGGIKGQGTVITAVGGGLGIKTNSISTLKAASLLPTEGGAPLPKKKKKVAKGTTAGETARVGMSMEYAWLRPSPEPSPPHLSAAQAAVDDMMRQALQEYVRFFSFLG